MPGYEPFLLCDLHVHTRWSDGALQIPDVIDLYGQTGAFDVIAITDHVLRTKDWLARAGRAASLGRRQYSVTEDTWADYLAEIKAEAARAREEYDLLVVPGAEITRNHTRRNRNAHIVALGVDTFISADQPPEEILVEIRRQKGLSVACHPHARPKRRLELETTYLWDHRDKLADLVDVWEAANRDDLFSVTSLKHFPYIANSDFHKRKHLYSWKTLVRAEKTWLAIREALCRNVDVAITLYRNGSWPHAAPACCSPHGRPATSCRPGHRSTAGQNTHRGASVDAPSTPSNRSARARDGCGLRRTGSPADP